MQKWNVAITNTKYVEVALEIEGIVKQKEPQLEDLENSQALPVVKNEKACSGQHTKDVTGQSLHKKVIQVWMKEHRDGMKYRKAFRLLGFHQMRR